MSIEPKTRRSFLATTTLAVGAALTSTASSQTPKLHQYKDYGWLRGFSVVPSWGARLEEAWWLNDGARFREEVGLARQVHANCIRLWIEFTAWMADPDKITGRFLDAVAAIDEAGMKTMPCLFNRWHDGRYDYGGTYLDNLLKGWKPHLDYVRALATPLAKDERVLIWDLCNEPQAGASWAKGMTDVYSKKEHDWLADIARTLRECEVQQPVSMGTMSGANIETYADLRAPSPSQIHRPHFFTVRLRSYAARLMIIGFSKITSAFSHLRLCVVLPIMLPIRHFIVMPRF